MSDKICSACLAPEDDWLGSAKARCGHSMCLPCCLTWSKTNASCPECRADFMPAAPAPSGDEDEDLSGLVMETAEEAIARHQAWTPDAWAQHNELIWGQRRAWQRAHAAQVAASRERRQAFLEQTRLDWTGHCATCTDPVCMANHVRRTNWLQRGKLTAQPQRLDVLGNPLIGLLLSWRRISKTKFAFLRSCCSPFPDLYTLDKRSKGLLRAIANQKAAAADAARWRQTNAGSVTTRLSSTLEQACVALVQDPVALVQKQTRTGKVTVFKGFTPPRRGARTGDLYVRGTATAICVGYHNWYYSDGSRMRLINRAWVFTPAIDFEAVD